MRELADYLEAVAVLDGLPAWYSSEQARLRGAEQQAKLKAEADAGRRRDEIAAHRKLVETSLTEARSALRDVALGQAIPSTVKPQAVNPPKGADDLASDIKAAASDIRRLSRKLKNQRQAAHELHLAEEEAARERARERELAEAERRRREQEAAMAGRTAWDAAKQRALTTSGAVAGLSLLIVTFIGMASGLMALLLAGLVLAAAVFGGLFTLLKPKGERPDVTDTP